MRRETYEDADFTKPILERSKRSYERTKLALARADEAVRQLGLEPLIRMADDVLVDDWGPGITMSFQECVRPWLIPAIGETGLPWADHNYWELGSFGLWTVLRDGASPWREKRLYPRHQETAVHVMVLHRDQLRALRVNGRKKRPVEYIRLRIHQKSPGWKDNKLVLPNGCICEKRMEASIDDVVTKCRMPS